MATEMLLIDPSDQALYVIDWTDALGAAITIAAVTHIAPSPLIVMSEGISVGNLTTFVKLRGGVHGNLYMIECQVTLSNGEILNRQVPVRVFNS
jgi:hypothetical protein